MEDASGPVAAALTDLQAAFSLKAPPPPIADRSIVGCHLGCSEGGAPRTARGLVQGR